MHRQSISTFLAISCVAIVLSPRVLGAEIANSEATLPLQSDGEDLGAEEASLLPSNGLSRVQQNMAVAQSALAAVDTSGKASAAQHQVVEELDAMIAQLQKQCEKCGGQCNKPPNPSNKPPKPSAKRGNKPGGEAAGVAKTQAAGQVDRAAVSNLVKDIWGRLPERQREELLQPLSEEFLPEYAAEIEEYFRVLAETPADDGAEKQP